MKLSILYNNRANEKYCSLLSCDRKLRSHDENRKSRDSSELDTVAHGVVCRSFEGTAFSQPPREGTH